MAESGGRRPVFFYDFASPWSYLAAERVNAALGMVPVWQPVDATALAGADGQAESAAGDALRGGAPLERAGISPLARLGATRARRPPDELVAAVERRALAQGLPPIRWPEPWPPDGRVALRAAIFAQGAGRVVAFSLAALRQAFAAGRDLGEPDNVLVAAAACELHPRAVLKGIESATVSERLEAASSAAVERGLRRVPAIALGDEVFEGEDAVEAAAVAIGGA